MDVSLVEVVFLPFALDELGEQGPVQVDVFWVGELRKGHRDELSLRVAEHPLQSGIASNGVAIHPHQSDSQRRSLKDGAEASLAPSEGVLVVLPLLDQGGEGEQRDTQTK